SGKTTSLKALFNHFGKKNEVFSIENTMGRTLFFDYGIISFQNSEWKLKIHTYSTTGQDFYLVTRPVTLRGIDGLIFVADSQKSVYERNIASWNEVHTYFNEEFIHMPKILAFNKQDLTEKFNTLTFLNEIKYNIYENIDIKYTIALNGEGILDSFEELLALVFKALYGSVLAPNIENHLIRSR
ncbi:MAG: GTPase domain-containing protein, partial [Promethearchaeota archaeon]